MRDAKGEEGCTARAAAPLLRRAAAAAALAAGGLALAVLVARGAAAASPAPGTLETFAGPTSLGLALEVSQKTGSVATTGGGNSRVVYTTDAGACVVRKIDASGNETIVAGNGTCNSSGDTGSATSAELNAPAGVAVDNSGNLLIADTSNNRVRMVAGSTCSSGCAYGLTSTTAGDIYTVAGGGTAGYSGDGGAATSAAFHDPYGVAVDGSGDLLIADQYSNRIREVGHALAHTTTTTTSAPASTTTTAPTTSSAPPAAAATTTAPSTSAVAPAAPQAAGSVAVAVGSSSVPVTVSWPAATFAAPVMVSVSAAASGSGGVTFAAGTVAIQLAVTHGDGTAVTSFAQPVEIVLPDVPAGAEPGYSHDGTTWTAIPQVPGPGLPAGYPDGWFRDSGGALHLLTLHATYFAALPAGTAEASALTVGVRCSRRVNLRYTHALKVQVSASLPAGLRVTLARDGRRLLSERSVVLHGYRVVRVRLPRAADRPGVYRLTVTAVARSLHATRSARLTFLARG